MQAKVIYCVHSIPPNVYFQVYVQVVWTLNVQSICALCVRVICTLCARVFCALFVQVLLYVAALSAPDIITKSFVLGCDCSFH